MAKLFGTDGVRGIVSSELNIELATKLGSAVVRVLKNNDKKLTFLIGSDTRISKDVLKNALIAGILSENANVIDLGVIPTPAVSYLITKYQVDGGFVISASHNPSEYNGIKVFNNEGFKLADELEAQVEEIILNNYEYNKEINKLGTYLYQKTAIDDYVDYLASTLDCDLSKFVVGLDLANGAAYETAKKLFTKLNVKYKVINDRPDGLNINQNCGSTHIEALQKFVVDEQLDCGFAFDGDADRVLMVDHLGQLVDGDKIIAIYGKYLHDSDKLKNNTLVGTVMSNLGLVKFCEQENINFVATKVGDRHVLESMLKNDYIVGGEQSGHIIFKEFANTGDGELTAVQILNVMAKTNKSLAQLATVMETYPQVLKNVHVKKESKETYQNNKNVTDYLKEQEKLLNNEGRILVRASGTENLIRVMLEGKDIAKITEICDNIVNFLDKELN